MARWTTTARQIQQSYLESLGDRDWDLYTHSDYDYLKFKIAYAIFGPPENASDIDNIRNISGYTQQQYKVISPIFERICEFGRFSIDGKEIYMSILFVCLVPKVLKKDFYESDIQSSDAILATPVFKIRKCINAHKNKDGCVIFLDDAGRQYTSWRQYLVDNKLPKGVIIGPRNGRYCGIINQGKLEVSLIKIVSPANSASARVRKVGDIAGATVALGALSTIGVSLFVPVAASVGVTVGLATLATSVYGITTSSITLADRGRHGQSIGLGDAEARGCWLNIGASTAGVVAGAGSQILSKVASNGVAIGRGVKVAHDVAIVTALVTGGAGLVDGIATAAINYNETGRLPSNLQLFQMASSALFLTNSLINNRMASTIVTEAQSGAIYNIRTWLGENSVRKVFDKIVAETQHTNGHTQGNSEVIRGIKRIHDVNQFFKGARDLAEQLEGNVKMSLNSNGELMLNGNRRIDPCALSGLSSADRSEVLRNISNVTANNVSVNSIIGIGKAVSGVVTFAVTLKNIFNSFPSLSVSSLQSIEGRILLFNDFTEGAYNQFVKIVNRVFELIDVMIIQRTRAMGIEDGQLLEQLIVFVRNRLLNIASDIKITIDEVAGEYFRGGILLPQKVKQLYDRFKNLLNVEYEKRSRQEVECTVCSGIRFSIN